MDSCTGRRSAWCSLMRGRLPGHWHFAAAACPAVYRGGTAALNAFWHLVVWVGPFGQAKAVAAAAPGAALEPRCALGSIASLSTPGSLPVGHLGLRVVSVTGPCPAPTWGGKPLGVTEPQ